MTRKAVLAYGVLLIVMGLWGYYEAKSQASLFSGVGFGTLLVVSAFLKPKPGLWISLGTTTLLTITFAIRYVKTGKTVPGAMLVLSAAMLILLLIKAVRWRRS